MFHNDYNNPAILEIDLNKGNTIFLSTYLYNIFDMVYQVMPSD